MSKKPKQDFKIAKRFESKPIAAYILYDSGSPRCLNQVSKNEVRFQKMKSGFKK